tara:strand:- start:5585 stop:6202 length:618 start_codon:yes stop_codon:yes gene_type:complete
MSWAAPKALKSYSLQRKTKMSVELVNFDNEESNLIIKKYCIESSPFASIDNNKSISFRDIASDNFVKSLEHECRLSVCSVSSGGDYLFFAFFKKSNNDFIDLHFALPNTNLKLSPVEMRVCFYDLCIYALDKLGVEEIEGKVMRVSKKNSYKIFLKRYIKAITYKENEHSEYDHVYLNRESILAHCEKLKIQSNRNKLGDKTSRE